MHYNLTEQTANALEFTRKITTRWNDRLTGSQACLDCADEIHHQLSTFCHLTQIQSFKTHPKSFLGFIRINIVLYFGMLVFLWWGFVSVSAVLGASAILITVLQFFLYKEFLDSFYREKEGKNVVGIIEPTHEVKQQILVTAHHDSANVFNILQNYPKHYGLIVNSGLGVSFLLALLVIGLAFAKMAGADVSRFTTSLIWIFSFASILVVPLWFFHRPNQGTPGAGDNMICTAVSLEIGKYFSALNRTPDALKHTRVMIGSWDAEEVGLRGARAFLRENKQKMLQTKTYNYNLECLYDHREMGMLTSDLNSFVKLSRPMAEECISVGQQLGYTIKPYDFPLLAGGTDAAEFAKAGIEATTFHAMSFVDKGENPAYHTLRDTVEAVDAKAVAAAIEVGIQYILQKDRAV